MNRQISVLQFNPTDVKFTTGYIHSDKFCLLQCSSIDNFSIDDKDNVDKLKTLIDKAREDLKIDLGSIVVLYPPVGLNIVSLDDDTYTIKDNDNSLSINDYYSCSRRMLRKSKTSSKKELYTAPYAFYIDNDIRLHEFASGIQTETFYVKADIFQIDEQVYNKYNSLCQQASIKAKLELISTYPLGNYIQQSLEEKDFITLKLDENYTYLSLFEDYRLKSSIQLNTTLKSCFLNIGQQLEIDYERVKVLFSMIGFSKDFGFEYESDENLSLEKINTAFESCFKPLVDEIKSVLETIENKYKIYIYGNYNLMDRLIPFIEENIDYEIVNYKKRIIGSGDGSYLDCILTINLASLPYQQTSYINNADYDNNTRLKKVSLSR